MSIIELHLHTRYSVGDALPSSWDYARAAGKGSVLAIVDHDNMGGIYAHKAACEKYGVKPIYGVEITLDGGYSLVLLAMTNRGLENLYALLGTDRTTKDLHRYSKDVIALSGNMTSALAVHFLNEDMEEFHETFGLYKDIFGDRFFLEIIDHNIEEQRRYNEYLKSLGWQTVKTNDVHYLNKGDHPKQAVLICDRLSRVALDPEVLGTGIDEAYLKPLPDNPNAQKIADMCNVTLRDSGIFLPAFEVPEGFKDEGSFLKHLVWKGLKERGCTSKEYIDRAAHEIRVIEDMGFIGYFLIVWDFIEFAHKSNIPVGPGRGSGAGSLVAYALYITNVDPIEGGLLFERFLNPDRVSMPDFDIDFCRDGRSRVIEYVTNKYGEDCVSAIGTYGELKPRAAWKSAARVLGMPFDRQNMLSGDLPDPVVDDAKLKDIFDDSGNIREELKDKYPVMYRESKDDDKVRLANRLSTGVEGAYKNIGRHAAGILISDGPAEKYIPVWHMGKYSPIESSDDGIKTMSQLDMRDAERAGLVKFDFLGLMELTVIDYAIMLIKEEYGIDININDIPKDDPKVFKMLAEGDTLGTFQIASQGMTEFVKILKPESLNDIIAVVALYRPGPMDYGDGMHLEYARRKNGEAPVTFLHENLREILDETYGVIVYQEQIMEIARKVAGYSLGKADILRRAMGKKHKDEMDREKANFLSGARRNGYSDDIAEDLWEQISTFSRYGFNKSHAASYGLITYQTAWLKANFPEELMAAQMQVRSNKLAVVAEFIHSSEGAGLEVMYPDVQIGNKNFITKNKKIYAGLKCIRGVTEDVCDRIEREGPFKNLTEFFTKVKIGRGALKTLLYSGALDSLVGATTLEKKAQFRSDLYNQADKFLNIGKSVNPDQMTLFPMDLTLQYRSCEPMSIGEMLKRERHYMGLYRSAHPIEFKRKRLTDRGGITISEALSGEKGSEIEVCGVIIDINVIITKSNESMCFITLEDETGRMDVTVFPDTYSMTNFQEGDILMAEVKQELYEGDLSAHLVNWEVLEWDF